MHAQIKQSVYRTTFNKVNPAKINDWSTEKYRLDKPFYLFDTASLDFENLKRRNANVTWRKIKDEFFIVNRRLNIGKVMGELHRYFIT